MKVHYMNGAGNDFMVLDARGRNLNFPQLANELCKLTDADGFMALDHSDTADFRLHFYNSDGSRGEMCGNGARCICRYAYELGLVGEKMVIQTDAGLVPGTRISQDIYRVQLNVPSILDLHRTSDAAYVELGNPGVPHSVTEIPGLCWEQREQLRSFAKEMRFHSAFPKGANANFYTWLSDDSIRILTYERGVEDYTLACGTGSGATAAALWAAGKVPSGVLLVKNPGGDLKITVEGHGEAITALFLEGPTEIVNVYEI
ncbi:MAG: diaminopimelate epimerase [Ruminococcaceae bacterium]|nr:diaminopimelate epimerase [Oscillospiraceae bacterium]